jgi:addiction module RelB/DinJ family antitoxin
MKVLFRARVDKKLLQQAQRICKEMGLDTQEAVRLLLAAIVRRRELPFKISAETPEDELLQPQARRSEILESFYGQPYRAQKLLASVKTALPWAMEL